MRGLAITAGIALAFVLAGACSSPSQLCDPGSVIFCRCGDGEAGSKVCNDDGQSFQTCLLQQTGEVCPKSESGSITVAASSGPAASSSSASSGTGAGGAASSSASSASSSATGGGGGVIAGCPGEPLTAAIGTTTTVSRDTTLAPDLAAGPCGGSGAPDLAFQVTPADSGGLHVSVVGIGAFDPVVYARAGACDTGASVACADTSGPGGTETLDLEAVAGVPVWVFVDGHGGASGAFVLSLQMDAKVPGDHCPGIDVTLDPGVDVTTVGDTSIAGADYKGVGACAASTATSEIVYGVMPSADGTLTVTMTPAAAFDAELYARSGTCTTTANQVACSESAGPGGVESIAFPVVAGTRYSVFADGNAGSSGAYSITFHLQ